VFRTGRKYSCIYWIFKGIVKLSYQFIENVKAKETTWSPLAALTTNTEEKYSKNYNSDRRCQ